MLSRGVPPAQKLKWQMRSSIKQITHTGVPPWHKLHTTKRRSYLIQIIHTGNPHYINFTSVTLWCSSMKQITHIGVPPSHKLYTLAFLDSSMTHAPATHDLNSYSKILICWCDVQKANKFSAGHHTHIPQSAGVQLAFSTIVICKLSWWKIDNII